MKKSLTSLALISTLLITSASAQKMGMMSTAYVRVVHAVSDAPAVDVYVDGTRTVAGAAFKAVTPYGEVPAGAHTVKITAAGNMKAVVFQGKVNLKPGVYYTVAAAGYLRKVTPIIFYTNRLKPGGSKVAVTVYHLAPDAPPVQALAVDMNKTPLLGGGLRYGYDKTLMVPPMAVNLDIVPFGKMMPVVKNVSGISITAGNSYSLFAVGTLGKKTFDVVVVPDQLVMGSMGSK